MTALAPLLAHLLGAPVEGSAEDMASWSTRSEATRGPGISPAEEAVRAGFLADRVAWAFASGYRAACARMFDDPSPAWMAFCVTESGGGRPRDMAATVRRDGDAAWRLDGDKSFVTLAGHATRLYVVARELSETEAADRPRLRVARVPAGAQGVAPGPTFRASFVPEIEHGPLHFESVRVAAEDVLEGDGYTRFVRPFRTVEDLHVLLALEGHLVRIARQCGAPGRLIEEILASIAAGFALSESAPDVPALHVAVGGWIAGVRRLASAMESVFATADARTRERWARDRALFEVAEKVRSQRLQRAWDRVRESA